MGSIYVPWLADAARSTGYRVVEVRGWRGRGHGGFRTVEGVAGHHTATSARARGDYPSLNIVTNGRSDLRGPLCNLGLGRNGTIYVVAAGVAWHAGASRWAGFADLNDEFLGIEAESPGYGEWTDAQLDAYPRLVGALLRYMNRGKQRYAGHKDVCIPRGRKPDPRGIGTTWMQNTADKYRTGSHRGRSPATRDLTPYLYTEDSIMEFPAGKRRSEPIPVSVLREHDIVISPNDANVVVHDIYYWGMQGKDGKGNNPAADKDITIDPKHGHSTIVPKGTAKADVVYTSNQPFRVGLFPR